MRIGSLFSGAGGLDLAVEAVFGATTAWHCELDPAASKVLAARWPGVPNLGDITAADWTAVEPVSIVCGGFPCQDVSSAGKRAGMRTGTRSGLWEQMAGAIAVLGPRYVVIENVKGLLSAEAYRDVEPEPPAMGNGTGRPVLRAIGAVLGGLWDVGYDAQWVTVGASAVGAPHQRDRVFILATTAHPDSGRRAGRPQRDLEPAAELAAPRGNDANRRPMDDGGVERSATGIALLPTPTSRDYKGRLNRPGRPARPDGRPRLEGDDSLPDAIARVTEGAAGWGKYEPAVKRWEALTGPAPAAAELGRTGRPRVRPAFSEWLLGLPAGWITGLPLPRTEQLRVIGNGVCPQQAAAALRYLLTVAEVAA